MPLEALKNLHCLAPFSLLSLLSVALDRTVLYPNNKYYKPQKAGVLIGAPASLSDYLRLNSLWFPYATCRRFCRALVL